jgi:hypothetical protein
MMQMTRSWIVVYIPVYTTIHDHADHSASQSLLAVIIESWKIEGEVGAREAGQALGNAG